MPDYHVIWEIDVVADNPEAAAREARRSQLAPGSLATVFDVLEDGQDAHRVDLAELDQQQDARETLPAILTRKPLKRPICPQCRSPEITRDASAEWDFDAQVWSLKSVYDNTDCDECGEEISSPIWITEDPIAKGGDPQ